MRCARFIDESTRLRRRERLSGRLAAGSRAWRSRAACRSGLAAAVIGAGSGAAVAMPVEALVDSWLVSVDGVSGTRTLRISAVDGLANGDTRLIAQYGMTGAKLSPVRVTAKRDEGSGLVDLHFVSQLGSEIQVHESPDGGFEGTFMPRGGATMRVRLRRMDPGTDMASSAQAYYVVKPAPDVPAACAQFSGLWEGQWSFFQSGKVWLWVLEIDASCKAKLAHQSTLRRPDRFFEVSLRQGVADWQTAGARYTLTTSGDSLFLNASGAVFAHVTNSARLTRIDDTLP